MVGKSPSKIHAAVEEEISVYAADESRRDDLIVIAFKAHGDAPDLPGLALATSVVLIQKFLAGFA